MNENLQAPNNGEQHRLRPSTPEGRVSISSARSQYDLTDAMDSSTPHLKTYGFYNANWHMDTKICDEAKNVIYFSETHDWSSAPDVVLRQGVDKHAPVLAVAQFRYSQDLKLGLGDPDAGEQYMIWEDLKNATTLRLRHTKYRFEMTIGHERRSFLWQRTRDSADGVHGMNKLGDSNYRLVDERTGEVLAVYLDKAGQSWRKTGKLQFKGNLGHDWERMVLIGCLGLCEKERRRNALNAASG
jgi:hypothetical protein